MGDEKIETVEVTEPTPEPKPEQKQGPTRDELKEKGWSAAEMDAAEKRGMVAKPDDKKEEPKPDGKKEDKIIPPGTKVDPRAEGQPERRAAGDLPDFTIKDPEKERVFLETFGPGTPQRAMYFRMKNERQARQKAEGERDRASQEAQALRDRIAALEGGRPTTEVDENGNPVDPEDRPLTVKQWKEMQRQEAEDRRKADDELRAQAGKVADALKSQEEFAKATYPDFEPTLRLAKDLMLNMDRHVPDKAKQAKLTRLIQSLQTTAAEADRMDLDDYNASMIAYEIGQMHPDYGKQIEGDGDGKTEDPSKANGGLTPEEMERMKKNTQRRSSSASLPAGGGKRTVSVEDVDLKVLQRMSREERESFKVKHPGRYKQLLRG